MGLGKGMRIAETESKDVMMYMGMGVDQLRDINNVRVVKSLIYV